jgi:two-component system, chemotaxis family, sensor kinase CheA
MSTEDQETMSLFLEESFEGLTRADGILLEMEQGKAAPDRMNALFREVHTIKGTSGFLELKKIEALSHAAEDLLARLRDGTKKLDGDIVTVLLAAVDQLRRLLGCVQQEGREGDDDVAPLVAKIRAALDGAPRAAIPALNVTIAPRVVGTTVAPKPPPPRPTKTPDATPGFELYFASESPEDAPVIASASLNANIKVTTLADGGEALGRLRGLRPGDIAPTADVALLSLGLMVLDGAEVIRRYNEGDQPTRKVPILLIADSKEEGERALARTGSGPGVEIVVRPIDEVKLVDALRNAVSRARAAAPPQTTATRSHAEDATIRVGVGLLDQVMNLVGELVLVRNQILQVANMEKDQRANVLATAQRLNVVTSELQESVMRTRMQPIARLFEQIPRMVRSASKACGKEVNVQIDGNTTELDRTFIELMRDPLMHIIRNSIDHGIETPTARKNAGKAPAGSLRVRAFHEGGSVNIEIVDDGAGIDPRRLRNKVVEKGLLSHAEVAQMSDREAIDLIFMPGFSTAEKVSSISGRGVGMDVVRTQIERAGGQVEIQSTVGRGTTVGLKIPLTLAIVPALMISAGARRFAIPQINVLELVRVNPGQAEKNIEHVRGAEIFRLRGTVLPLVRLRDALKIDGAGLPPEQAVNIVVVAAGERKFGLVVDGVHDTIEIVVKALHRQLKRIPCYSGATILGDGSIALILDVVGLASMFSMKVVAGRAAKTQQGDVAEKGHSESVLVFSAGGVQCAVPLSLVSRIEKVACTKIENVGGREVLQYRNEIMPIVRPELALGLETRAPGEEQPIVVFDFGEPIGFAVDSIVDIVETSADTVRARDVRPGVLGSIVLQSKTSLLLDVFQLVRTLAPGHASELASPKDVQSSILIVDDSAVMRSVIANYLTACGYTVSTVVDGESALAAIEVQRFAAVVTDLEMPGIGGLGLIERLRAKPEGQKIPIIVVSRHSASEMAQKVMDKGANAFLSKLHRDELEQTLARLVPNAARRAA